MATRREFLKVIGTAGGAAVAGSCSPAPPETLIPYLVAPDQIVSGEPAFIATTCRECSAGCGVFAKTIDGRVIKLEGNPAHPVNAGALCARGQAAVQTLYDPDRFTGPLLRNPDGSYRRIEWNDGEARLADKIREARSRGANRVAWLGRLATGSFEQLTRQWLALARSERRLFVDPLDDEPLRRATERLTGTRATPRYHLDRANFVLSFGADFADVDLELSRGYADLRRRRSGDRFGCSVFASPRLSLSGRNADWWIPARPGGELALALAILHEIDGRGVAPESVQSTTDVDPETIRMVAKQFISAAPSVALGGGHAARDAQAVELELAVLQLNAAAGNLGRTVTFDSGAATNTLSGRDELDALRAAIERGEIDVLLLHHANPVYALPGTWFESAIARVPFLVSFASAPDETTAHAHLVLPDHHWLESWGDFSAREGILSVVQPAMTPLLATRSTADVLLNVGRSVDPSASAILGTNDYAAYAKTYWTVSGAPDAQWSDALKHGGAFAEAAPTNAGAPSLKTPAELPSVPTNATNGLTLITFPSALLGDGHMANAAWLQEVPDPTSGTVWDGRIEVHPSTAAKLGVAQDDLVSVQSPHGRVTTTVRVTDGVRPDVVAMPLGYGRTASLQNAYARGARAAALLPPDGGAWRVDGVSLARQGRRRLIVLQAVTEPPAGRPPIAQTIAAGAATRPHANHPPDLYPPHRHDGHRWGMAIDLNACTGCSACVVACYAENNVPVVGERACAEGREMSWIRIERYDAPRTIRPAARQPGSVFLPMLCQQCDEAPCESVCPVYATYHNPEGLNAQVYVRCIGTRFCSNNCPYKVRRFNWQRPAWKSPLEMQLNPEVTVRSSGVMEKCTFCVQRIQRAKIEAAREQRPLHDGDVTPACAQTCPTRAIVFGDLNDATSRVARLARDRRGYRVLEELNTRPAITYLERVVPSVT
jgi:anaerobic selenocysteine-containing dehydrogenase/Fe-S-cluster-containing dehydrogenase component